MPPTCIHPISNLVNYVRMSLGRICGISHNLETFSIKNWRNWLPCSIVLDVLEDLEDNRDNC